jgi:hypothetical protein
MRTPASLLLGALAPMPPPIATGPPGMMHVTERQGYVRENGVGWGRDAKKAVGRHEKRSRLFMLIWRDYCNTAVE